jgi:hypothetical protein
LIVKKASNQTVRGCLAVTLAIIFLCGFWSVLLGPKGILVGLAQYFVMRFADFFHDVFAPRQEK